MEIKDLIRELRAIYTCSLKEAIDVSGYDLEKYSETFNQIESTIIEFWKHKQMWEELKKIHKWKHYIDSLEYFEQKYFPKELDEPK